MNTKHLTPASPARSYRSIRTWLLSGLCAAASLLTAHAQLEWELLHPEPTYEALNDIAYDGSQFVIGGEGNTLLSSQDGTNWTKLDSATSSRYFGIAGGNNHWVAVGIVDAAFSNDGTNWFRASGGENVAFHFGTAYGNGRFVSVGDTLAYSTTGENWQASLTALTNRMWSVAFGEGQFVAVGDHGKILSTGDGMAWTEVGSPVSTKLTDIAYGGGKFVAGGADGVLLVSEDGAAWTLVETGFTGEFRSIAYGADRFLATSGSGIAYTSPDGIQWTQAPLLIPSEIRSVVYGNGVFVGVAEKGMIYTSPNGTDWNAVTSPRSIYVSGIAQDYRDGSLIVTGPNGEVFTSPDGAEWQLHQTGASLGISKVVQAFNSLYIGLAGRGTIATSTNGLDWNPTKVTSDGTYLRGLIRGPFRNLNVYAVGDKGQIYFNTPALASAPSTPWIQAESPTTNHLHDLAAGHGMLIAIANREIISTADGTNWTSIFATTNNSIMHAVAFGKNRFVAVGQGEGRFAMLVTSTNGSDWETIYPPGLPSLFDIAYGNGRFVAISGGSVYESADGLNWTDEVSLTSSGLLTVECLVIGNRSVFYALGNGGMIFRASHVRPRLTEITRPEPGSMRFVLVGETGRIYRIESSTDLIHWFPYTETGPINYPTNVYNFPTSEGSRRFFRAIRQ